MAEAPLWAQALKKTADLGTVVGNGLLLGQGTLARGAMVSGVSKLGNLVGLTPDVSLKDAMESAHNDIAAARDSTGALGSVAETAAGLFTGGALAKGLPAAWSAIKAAPAAIAKIPGVAKVAGGAAAGLLPYTMLNAMGDYSDKDFAPPQGAGDKGQSSATTGAQPASKQVGPAATAEADWSPRKKAFVDFMSSASLPMLSEALKAGTIGQTAPLKPRDAAFGQLSKLLQQQYAEDAQTDPAKARMNYMRGLQTLLNPSGVMYMPDAGDQ